MRIYELRMDTRRYLGLVAERAEDNGLLVEVGGGESLRAKWQPIRMSFDREWDGTDHFRRVGDFASTVSSCPIFSKLAVDELRTMLETHGEVLPLTCDEGDFFVYNQLTVRDAVDLERSQIEWLPSGGIMEFTKLVFLPDRIGTSQLFMIPKLRATVFVTDQFVQLVEKQNLTGFRFIQVG